MAVTVFSIWWIGLAFAHAVLLRELPHGGGIIVDMLVGTFLGDTGAYFGGRMYGQRPLAPRLSPNKTVEGLMIGMVTAVFATWFAGLYQDWLPGTHALLLGIGVALAAPIGDLFESLIKREAQTKDTGRLFGAHGGALDRLDAVFFTVVTGYYIWVALPLAGRVRVGSPTPEERWKPRKHSRRKRASASSLPKDRTGGGRRPPTVRESDAEGGKDPETAPGGTEE